MSGKVVEGAIGIFDLETSKILKVFKLHVIGGGKSAKIEIKFKDKTGEPKKLVKEYKAETGRPALIGCLQAVCKYWPKFNPTKHRPAVLSQDEIKSVNKKRKGNKK